MKTGWMVLLGAIALLAACVSEQQYNQKAPENQQFAYMKHLSATQPKPLIRGSRESNADQITSESSPADDGQRDPFPEGGWELSCQVLQELDKIMPSLKGISGKQIVIEG